MQPITLELDRHQAAPLYLQIYQRFRSAITEGRLQPSERVPSVRSLASALGVARGTVEAAYQLLTGEGYFLPQGAAGTCVAPQLAQHPQAMQKLAQPVAHSPPAKQGTELRPLPLRLGLPALDAFPRKLWTRLAAQNVRRLGVGGMDYPDPLGHLPLRAALATYLGISRGIQCKPEQVFVCAGYRGVLDLICRSLLQAGDACWVEDPGYLRARQLLEAAGAQLVPVPVDQDGLVVEAGVSRADHARFAVVTPSHQSPLCVSLSLARRLALLDWAQSRKAWIIEDDYDSEYRYQGRPLPALKSLDRQGRVLYCGTFSKVLFPGLRLAYLVVPHEQVDRFARNALIFQMHCSEWTQATVADFLMQGHFSRHMKKMRALYAVRRGYLLEAVQARLGAYLHVDLQAGGMHVLAQLVGQGDDAVLADRANAAGLPVQALSRWCMQTCAAPGLLMGFTNITSAQDAAQWVQRLGTALDW